MKKLEPLWSHAWVDLGGRRLRLVLTPVHRVDETRSDHSERIRLLVRAGTYCIASRTLAEAMLAHPDLVKSLGI